MEPELDYETNDRRKKDLDWWVEEVLVTPFLAPDYSLVTQRRLRAASIISEMKLPDSLALILVPIAKALNRVFVVNP